MVMVKATWELELAACSRSKKKSKPASKQANCHSFGGGEALSYLVSGHADNDLGKRQRDRSSYGKLLRFWD